VALRPQEIHERVSCSLTAEAGRMSRGALAPQRSYPGSFFLYRSWSPHRSTGLSFPAATLPYSEAEVPAESATLSVEAESFCSALELTWLC
jgi:hypothetical protein